MLDWLAFRLMDIAWWWDTEAVVGVLWHDGMYDWLWRRLTMHRQGWRPMRYV